MSKSPLTRTQLAKQERTWRAAADIVQSSDDFDLMFDLMNSCNLGWQKRLRLTLTWDLP
jgi:hypothetical protein